MGVKERAAAMESESASSPQSFVQYAADERYWSLIKEEFEGSKVMRVTWGVGILGRPALAEGEALTAKEARTKLKALRDQNNWW